MLAPNAIAPLEQKVAEARDRRGLLHEPGDVPPQGHDVRLHLADPWRPCVTLRIGTRSQGAAGLAPVVKLKPVRRCLEQFATKRPVGIQARLRSQGTHLLVHIPGPRRCRKGGVSKACRHHRDDWLMLVWVVRVMLSDLRLAVRRLVTHRLSQVLAQLPCSREPCARGPSAGLRRSRVTTSVPGSFTRLFSFSARLLAGPFPQANSNEGRPARRGKPSAGWISR